LFELDLLRTAELDFGRLCRDIATESIIVATSITPDDRLHDMRDRLDKFDIPGMRVECRQMFQDVALLTNGLERRYWRFLCGVGLADGSLLAEKAADVLSKVIAVEEVLEKERASEITLGYKSSLLQANKSAGKRAYMASQLPEEWVPTAVRESDTGEFTADPLKILMAEAAKLKALWNGVESSKVIKYTSPWGGSCPLPRITPDEWRQASVLFPAALLGPTMDSIRGIIR